jgi:hypothetical protein
MIAYQKLRQQVAQRSRFRCSYCLTQEKIIGTLFTIDHIIPESLNGSSDLENLTLACWECNLIKNDRIAGIDPHTGLQVRLFNQYLRQLRGVETWRSVMDAAELGKAVKNPGQ